MGSEDWAQGLGFCGYPIAPSFALEELNYQPNPERKSILCFKVVPDLGKISSNCAHEFLALLCNVCVSKSLAQLHKKENH